MRHFAAGLLDFAELLAHPADRLVGGLELLRHGDLGVTRKFAGRRHAGQQFLPDLPQLRGYRLGQMIDLRVNGLALRRQRRLHFLAHSRELRLRPAAGAPHDRAK